MAIPITATLLICVKAVLYVTFTRGMEADFCKPVRVDPRAHGKHLQMNERQVIFRINAFKREFYLHLLPDSNFLGPGSGKPFEPNASTLVDLRKCFYSGNVNLQPDSFAALSLCKGINGGFYENGMEYFISLARGEDAAAEAGEFSSKTHVIHRRRSSTPLDGHFPSRCGVTPDSENTSLVKYKYMSEVEIGTVLESLGRSKRFTSTPRFVEVLVVADPSMDSFHGDELKHYLLTLMAVAAKLYKHPSILNLINIVVVGFVVLNEDDRGPEVSSNAALTLRNFCSWQRKLNKHSDRHPEYWDTAILFTKQRELQEVVHVWNTHRIRSCRNAASPGRGPVMMYTQPELFAGREYFKEVSQEKIEACRGECLQGGPYPCDDTVFDMCCLAMGEDSLHPPTSAEEAIELYMFLRAYMRMQIS